MTQRPRRSGVGWLVLLAALVWASGAYAQSYEWRNVVQDVTLQPDGAVVVDDTRTLWSSGDFGEAFICVAHNADQRVTLLQDTAALGPGPSWRSYSQPCDNGTEVVVHMNQRIKERRVRFHYRIDGSMTAYSDVVQWYWNVIPRDHPTIAGYHLTVHAPGPMAAPFDAYVHRYTNPENPVVTLSADRSTLTVTFHTIPHGDGVEVRYLMDPALFSLIGSRPGFKALLQDESDVAGLQSRDRTVERLKSHPLWGVVPLVVLLWLVSGVWGDYRRHGREPQVPAMRYPFEPPSNLPPAAVTALRMQTFSASAMGPAFFATIMDLVRRGYGTFTPKGRRFEMRLDPTRADTDLEPFERDVLEYLAAAAKTHRRGDPDFLEFSELKAYSKRHGATFVRAWGKRVRAWVEQKRNGPLVSEASRTATRRWTVRSLLAALLLGVGTFTAHGAAQVLLGVGAGLSLLTMLAAAASLPSWRPELAPEIQGWNGFKRTLTDYTRMKDAPLDFFGLWDVYYCYAAALGVADRYLKTVARAAPIAGADEAAMVQRGAWLGAHPGSGIASLSSMASQIQSLSSALNSASASASSGGSSAGGGGGGGGGGSSGGR